MYYDEIYEINSLKGKCYFKILKIKPTTLFSYQTILANVLGNQAKSSDPETLQKCADFILEHMMFSYEKEGEYREVLLPGLDNTNVPEIEQNPIIITELVSLFISKVTKPIEKN